MCNFVTFAFAADVTNDEAALIASIQPGERGWREGKLARSTISRVSVIDQTYLALTHFQSRCCHCCCCCTNRAFSSRLSGHIRSVMRCIGGTQCEICKHSVWTIVGKTTHRQTVFEWTSTASSGAQPCQQQHEAPWTTLRAVDTCAASRIRRVLPALGAL